MKILFAAMILATASNVISNEVRLKVVDEARAPVVGAKTIIAFTTPMHGGEFVREGLTDDRGLFSGSGRAVCSVFVLSEKDGYYGARFERLPNDRDVDLTVLLPRIIAPIPLLARKVAVSKLSATRRLPDTKIESETIGFDLMKGEMVAPYGAGVVSDVIFEIQNQFVGWVLSDRKMEDSRRHPNNRNLSENDLKYHYGNFVAELLIRFPGSQEGLVEVNEHFLPYSRLKMPHRAPEAGYAPTYRKNAKTLPPSAERTDVGFFLRTRVKLDKEGRIVSANYAKVVGDFRLDPRGFVTFTYYFNPTPNDRNLEFDPKRNLFPSTLEDGRVYDP